MTEASNPTKLTAEQLKVTEHFRRAEVIMQHLGNGLSPIDAIQQLAPIFDALRSHIRALEQEAAVFKAERDAAAKDGLFIVRGKQAEWRNTRAEAAEVEVRRLREALRNIRGLASNTTISPGKLVAIVDEIETIAEAALAAPAPEPKEVMPTETAQHAKNAGPVTEAASEHPARPSPVTGKVIYDVVPAGLTIECSQCAPYRVLYGVRPVFCAMCGGKFTGFDDSGKQHREISAREPLCHICGTAMERICPKCRTTTGVEPELGSAREAAEKIANLDGFAATCLQDLENKRAKRVEQILAILAEPRAGRDLEGPK